MHIQKHSVHYGTHISIHHIVASLSMAADGVMLRELGIIGHAMPYLWPCVTVAPRAAAGAMVSSMRE